MLAIRPGGGSWLEFRALRRRYLGASSVNVWSSVRGAESSSTMWLSLCGALFPHSRAGRRRRHRSVAPDSTAQSGSGHELIPAVPTATMRPTPRPRRNQAARCPKRPWPSPSHPLGIRNRRPAAGSPRPAERQRRGWSAATRSSFGSSRRFATIAGSWFSARPASERRASSGPPSRPPIEGPSRAAVSRRWRGCPISRSVVPLDARSPAMQPTPRPRSNGRSARGSCLSTISSGWTRRPGRHWNGWPAE